MNEDDGDLQPLAVARPDLPAAAQWPAPPAGTANPGRASGAAPVVAVLVVMMLIAGGLGFVVTSYLRTGTDFNRALAGQSPNQSPRGGPGATRIDPDESALGDLNVQQSDVSSRYRVELIPNGDSVAGATLNLCNGAFPSERLRTARRQVAAVDTLGSLALSTEAVLYRRPADSAQAFTELRALARNCPDRPVPSPTGGRTLTTKFGAPPDRSWGQVASVERIAFDVNTTDELGEGEHSIAVYLRRGRVLMGVYFGSAASTQPAVAGETSFAGITRVFATRLAEVPASVVDG